MSKRKGMTWQAIGEQVDAATVPRQPEPPKGAFTGQEFISAGQFGDDAFESRNKLNVQNEVKSILANALIGLLGKNKATKEMVENSKDEAKRAARINAIIEEEYVMSRTKIDLNITDETIL